jgi:ribonucleotide monophosphatase NagD (HAD superfamily)
MIKKLCLSGLRKTWIFDLDGTLLKHNGYMEESGDSILPGVKDVLKAIDKDDFVIILTARPDEFRKITIRFLKKNNIRYNKIIFNVPYGERILFNDSKPSGLKTAYAIECERDAGMENIEISIDT